MSGSKKNDISWKELMQFAAGKAEGDVFERVSDALGDSDHPANYLLHRQLGNPSRHRKISPTDIPDPEEVDSEQALEDAIAESAYTDIQAYLKWEQQRLVDALYAELPDVNNSRQMLADSERIYSLRAVNLWEVLDPYVEQIRELIIVEWNWEKQQTASFCKTTEGTAVALASFLERHTEVIPFNPSLLAVTLVKFGLSKFVGVENE